MVPTSSVTALKATMAGRKTTASITESSTISQVPITPTTTATTTTVTVTTTVVTGTTITTAPTITQTSDMVIASPVSETCSFVKGEPIKQSQWLSVFSSQIWNNVLKQSLSPPQSLLLLSVKCVKVS